MINKYQIYIFLLLSSTVFSITLTPKNALTDNNPPSPKLTNVNTSPATTAIVGKKGVDNQKEGSTDDKNGKNDQSSLVPLDNDQIGANAVSTKATSQTTNALSKETQSKLAIKGSAASTKLNSKDKKQDLTTKQTDEQTSNNNVNDQKEDKSSNQQQSSQKPKEKSQPKKSKWSSKSNSNKNTDKSSIKNQNGNQQQSGISWKLFLFIFILLFGGVIYATKKMYFPNASLPQMILDIMILFQTYLQPRNSGYKAPQFKEQIDDENSITVGYGQQYGKQLFWQKNSVEGI